MRTLFADRTRILFAALASLLVLFVAAPLLRTITETAPAMLWQTLLDEQVRASILLTSYASLISTAIAFVCGVPLAYLLARADFPGKRLIEGIINVPVVVPHSAAGIALLMVFGRQMPVGRVFGLLGVRFVSAVPGIVVAMLFVSVPFLVNAAREGFAAVNPRLERVARTLGASPWRAFWYVAFPLAWRNILSGMILMWARGLSEFGAVVILAYHPMVAPVLLYERFESFGLNYTRPVAALLILICLGVFVILRLAAARRASPSRKGVRAGKSRLARQSLSTGDVAWAFQPARRQTGRSVATCSDLAAALPWPGAHLGEKSATPEKCAVSVQELSADLGEFHLHRIDIDVTAGEYFVVLGPTGAGKTVLLETIAGLHQPHDGSILIGGEDVTALPPERRGVGFVYQDYALFPHLSVADNIAFGLKRDPRGLQDLLGLFGIEHLLHRAPETLSGGEQQRVALARALVTRPRLLLLDEPLSALDPQTREELQRELARLHRELGTTTIHVTHDFEEAIALGQRIAVVHEGQIVQVGSPEEIFRKPATEFVARFVGVRNVLRGEVQPGPDPLFRCENLEIAVVTDLAGPAHASIRPEDILLSREPLRSSARNCFRGHIAEIVERGALVYVTVSAPPDFVCAITCCSLEEMELHEGAEVYIAFKASAVHVF